MKLFCNRFTLDTFFTINVFKRILSNVIETNGEATCPENKIMLE